MEKLPALDGNGSSSKVLTDDASPSPIAVVGMAVRLPGGIRSPDELWSLIMSKKDARTRVPKDRFNVDAFHGTDGKAGEVGPHHGYFLEEPLGNFDAGFFTMSKAEVAELDPQQRLLLEVVWECMESGGQKNWKGSQIGCYVGVFGEDWLDLYSKDTQLHGMYRTTGTGDFVLANRVSYEYDLKGPSMTIRTGCSSALVGLHEACEAINGGHCTSAIVAGTNLIISPTMTQAMTMQGVLSKSGSCKTFDATADGYGRGEAINAVFIKKLDDAIRDRDPIRAVIRATASNCDGKTAGMSNPSPEAHETMMRMAYRRANLHAPRTAYVECHGTGTPVGDPLETTAVGNVFEGQGVYIGSVKPNVGHSEGASGITSLIKTVLALEHEIIPPNINFATPNPKIPFAEARLEVPVEPLSWPAHRERRASVNSFGIGGANVHVILDSAASFLQQTCNGVEAMEGEIFLPQLIPLSANSVNSLQRRQQGIQDYLKTHVGCLPDLSYTLGTRRDHLPQRSFAIFDKLDELEFADSKRAPRSSPELVYVFTGQGAQWAGMGAELMVTYSTFRDSIRRLDEVLQSVDRSITWSMEDKLLKPSQCSRLDSAEISQPLCTALQIGLIDLLRQWGVRPSAVVGHSSGEIAAAYASQAISAKTAILVAYYRGQVAKAQTRYGAMAAVGMGSDQVKQFLKPGVVVACENSPRSITLSGDEAVLDDVLSAITKSQPELLCRKLRVTTAYHSHHMTEVGGRYEELISGHVSSQIPAVPFFSSVHGKEFSSQKALDSAYWRANLEKPVRFSSAIQSIFGATSDHKVFLEIGPHSALAGPLRQIFKDVKTPNNPLYIPTLVRKEDQTRCVLRAAGALFQQGVDIDFTAVNGLGKVLTDLPPYDWQHDVSFWRESRVSRDWRLRQFPHHELLGSRVLESTSIEPSWRNVLKLEEVPWLRDHKIVNDIVFPAAGYITMVGEAIQQVTGSKCYDIRRLVVKSALMLHETQSVEVITTFKQAKLTDSLDSEWYEFTIVSYDDKNWMKHCTGQARGAASSTEFVEPQIVVPRAVNPTRWYSIMKELGLNYGPSFQGLQNIRSHPLKSIATAFVESPDAAARNGKAIHPSSIDQVLQLFTVAISNGLSRKLEKLAIPSYIGEIYVGETAPRLNIEVEAQITSRGAIHGVASVTSNGKQILTIRDSVFSALENDNAGSDGADSMAAVRLDWQPKAGHGKEADLLRCPQSRRTSVLLIEKVALLSLIETTHRLKPLMSELEHHIKFKHWIDMEVARIASNDYREILFESASWTKLSSDDRMALLDATLAEASKDALCCRVTPTLRKVLDNVSAVIQGSVSGLDILMEDQGLFNIYNCISEMIDLTPWFRIQGHSRPILRILEVGAGTGGITSQVLQGLTSAGGSPMYSEYQYTDISSGFFSEAKERFKKYDRVVYSVLDITKDPVEQGFEAGAFDIVIASNVLHATPSLGETLSNVRKLLVPGGRLFLQELSIHMRWINYIMGILPGWWLGASDGREFEPFVNPQRWDQELRDAGFSGVDTLVYDDEQPYQINAHMVSTATVSTPTPRPDPEIGLLYHTNICEEARAIAKSFNQAGFIVKWYDLSELPPRDIKIVSLLDLEEPFLYDLCPSKFVALQKFLSHCSANSTSIIWVTKPAQVNCQDPRYALLPGFSRTVRSEMSLELATFEVDQIGPESHSALIHLCQTFPESREDDSLNQDYEYAFFDGKVHVPRFHWISPGDTEDMTVSTMEDARLSIGSYGSLDSLSWEEVRIKEELGADEVEVEIRSVGLNFRDVLVVMGIIDNTHGRLGLEGSGVVCRIGPEVRDLEVGDRVFICDAGCFATKMVTTNKLCAKIPDNLEFEEAATMPCVYNTVIHSLINIGGLERGQSVLIHSACGGVGLAAIQICQMVGAEIFATVGSEEKIQHLVDVVGIPRDHIFNSRNAAFLQDLMQRTQGRGADLVLNSLSGELLHASWQCVAKYGKMLEIGKRDFIGHGMLSMDVFLANRSFFGIDLADIGKEKPKQCRRLLQTCLSYYSEGLIQPIKAAKTFEASQISDAFRLMQQGQHIGKIVINMPTIKNQLDVSPAPTRTRFRADSAYLLVGGLGGLGRAVSTWMVENGARYLVYLSRSAGASLEDRAFFNELKCQGCEVLAVKGSVANLTDVQKIIKSARKPIHGVIQMSMVLRDGNYLEMSYNDWETTLSSKVDGTWNLHKAFSDVDLDFFLLFSSISGTVGQWGQANYAAANTFLDSFVQYRQSQNLAASVIDIGVMRDVGYVSENATVLDVVRNTSTQMVGEADFLVAVGMAIQRSRKAVQNGSGYCNKSQLTIGLALTKTMDDPTNRAVWKRDMRMALYRNRQIKSDSSNGNTDSGLKEFLNIIAIEPERLHEQESVDLLTHEIGKRIKSLIFSSEEEELDPTRRLADIGVDSLVSIEVRNWWRRALGLEISVLEIMNEGSIERLAQVAREGLVAKHSERFGPHPGLSMKAP